MRSEESAIGVSGFLISCATRRATSRQAACFCARNRSERSSNTSTYPSPSAGWLSAETVTATFSCARGKASSMLAAGMPMRSARRRNGPPARRVSRNYSGRDALEDGFDVPAPAFERLVRGANIAVGSFDLAPAGFELFRHAVERLHQFGQFVGGADIDAVVQLPFGDRLRTRGQRRHGTVDQLRKQEREPSRGEQHHDRQQQQKSDVSPPKQL